MAAGTADRHPVAASIPMLDGYVAAIVAGPVSIDPLDWMPAARRRCQCLQSRRRLGVHGDLRRRAAPQRHQSRSDDHPGSVRANASAQAQWRGRSASLVRILRRHAAPDVGVGRRCSIPATSTTRCSCPSCCTVVTETRGVRCSDHLGGAARLGNFCATPTAIFQPSSRPCANTGCPPATPARA